MAESTPTQFLDNLAAVADGNRARLLSLLERAELTVTEICAVLQAPQSTVSRQLKVLVEHDWLRGRREGTRRYYGLELEALSAPERRVWSMVSRVVRETPGARQDELRLATVLSERRVRSQEFFDATSAEWDEMRKELFGSRFDLFGLLGFLDPSWTIGDLGCGSGPLSAAVAPFVERVVAVDRSSAMLETARARLQDFDNVDLRRGELESLPIDDGELDGATLALVLHHVSDPGLVVREAARALRPGGRLLALDMLPHEHEEYRQKMGHVWLGFSQDHVERQFQSAGLEHFVYRPLPADPAAKGPSLFVASGRIPSAPHVSTVVHATTAAQARRDATPKI